MSDPVGLRREFVGTLGLCVTALVCIVSTSWCAAEDSSGKAILEQLRGFNELGSVLHIAAHPDDENTQLITYLALGRRYRMAYMSVTRGDGGQNLLGPEFGEQVDSIALLRGAGGRFEVTVDVGVGVGPHRVEGTRGENPAVQHHLREQRACFLRFGQIDREMS